MSVVTVAIPVRDGGDLLQRTLSALAGQTVEHELLVCDSGSSDGSAQAARAHGARVLQIGSDEFSHGGTRNLLMREARGDRVAFLTQDAEPADELWLERLLGGFQLAEDVGLVYGPYRPRPDASPSVRAELDGWFASLSPDGKPRLDRLDQNERSLPVAALLGRQGFFTDANACVSRLAWQRVQFREVPYAEDRVLAVDMLRAGYAKAYLPDAAVVHSHSYSALQELRRCFDEWRGLREVYGWLEPSSPAHVLRRTRGELAATRRAAPAGGEHSVERAWSLLAAIRRSVARSLGAILGSRAELFPPGVRRALSLERRGSFAPLDLDNPPPLAHPKDPVS